MNFRQDAMSKLYPNWATIDNDTEVKDKEGNKITIDEVKISKEIQKLQTEYNSKQYQRDRLQEYPSIQELVVALYDEEDKASIIEKRNAVKAKYPKPE